MSTEDVGRPVVPSTPALGTEARPFRKGRWVGAYLAFWIIMSIGFAMVQQVLLPQRIKDLQAENPAAVLGLMTSVGSIVALVANILVGALSDRTRSRFGRRTPWLFWGGWITFALYVLMGTVGVIAAIVVVLWLSKLGFNMMNSPVYSSVSDRVPQEFRGTISSAIGFGNMLGYAIGALIGAYFINSIRLGFVLAAFCMLASALLFLGILPREPPSKVAPVANAAWIENEGRTTWQHIVYSFTPPLHAPDFWKAFACRTLLLLAIQMVAGYWLYLCQDYIGLGREEAAGLVSTIAVLQMFAAVGAIIVGPLSDRLRRRKPMVVGAAALTAIGLVFPWAMRSVTGIIIAAILIALATGIFMAIDQALNVDVLPSKEHAERDLGFINAATTAGQAGGMALTSAVVTATGGYTLVFPVAIAMAIGSAVFVLLITSVR